MAYTDLVKKKATKQAYNLTDKAKEMKEKWTSTHHTKYCDICQKDVNRKSYAKHTRTKSHISLLA